MERKEFVLSTEKLQGMLGLKGGFGRWVTRLVMKALEIDKVNEMFSLDLPESEEYMTVGGLILHEYQSFPKLNDIVKIGRFEFKIIKNTMTKIELVRLKVNE